MTIGRGWPKMGTWCNVLRKVC